MALPPRTEYGKDREKSGQIGFNQSLQEKKGRPRLEMLGNVKD
jgi:hypothetical protein